jgi:short-subunit dehydrogenase
MKAIVITGVSSGIGFDLTREFISHGYKVFGSVRSKKDAEKIKNEYGDFYFPLKFDVVNSTEILKAAELVKNELNGQTLSGIVNNAGIAVSGPILHIPEIEIKNQFEINLFGVLNVTRAFVPLLKGDNPGRIINISSVSGKNVFPFLGVYAASKHALEAISDALRRELALYGIKTVVIEPGSTQSAIWDKVPDLSKYRNTDFYNALSRVFKSIEKSLENIMPVNKVSKVVYNAFIKNNPKTRYVVVHNKLTHWWLQRLLPERIMDKLFKKMMYS